MKIYYQGEPGSYSHLASRKIKEHITPGVQDIIGCEDFDEVWKQISLGNIGVLPIENSYAGSIHTNVYNFFSYNHKIIGEYNFEVQHCLLSLENDMENIREAYSHHQALSQTQKYLKSHSIIAKAFFDTAGAAKMISDGNKRGIAAVASELAADLYGLNILERGIQDQEGNTTKFLVVVPDSDSRTHFNLQKGRVTFLLKTNHTPGSLHKCLGIFAERGINMTKIESLPLGVGHFSYAFWITIEGSMSDEELIQSFGELQEITDFVRVLGEY